MVYFKFEMMGDLSEEAKARMKRYVEFREEKLQELFDYGQALLDRVETDK